MNILIVVGSCLKINTSANLCHLAYIRGCIEAGYNVDVIAMSEKGCLVDKSIKLPQKAHWFLYDQPRVNSSPVTTDEKTSHFNVARHKVLNNFYKILKKNLLKMYGIYGRSANIWLKNAQHFSSSKTYAKVISLATPYFSHYLAEKLIDAGNVKCHQWIQIWEDPWTLDLYNHDSKKKTFAEEKNLLNKADKIIYSSPLTLQYQQQMFASFKNKMFWHTLPFYYEEMEDEQNIECNIKSDKKCFGYFGDYFQFSRNLKPFYEAAISTGYATQIVGNTDCDFSSTSSVEIAPRVGLSKLSELQRETNIYVFLCNLAGGQIPGKLYQYAVSNKPILIILDGRENEVKVLKKLFSEFERFTFCDNNVASISKAMLEISLIDCSEAAKKCIKRFNPKRTINEIL